MKPRPLTVKELEVLCKEEIKKGNGNKVIMLSDDDEGNGYHYCWYSFSTPEEALLQDYQIAENIASKEDTIILG